MFIYKNATPQVKVPRSIMNFLKFQQSIDQGENISGIHLNVHWGYIYVDICTLVYIKIHPWQEAKLVYMAYVH